MQFLSTLIDHCKSECHKFQWANHERQLNGYVALLSQTSIDLPLLVDKTLDELKMRPLIPHELVNKVRLLRDIIHQLGDGNFYGVTHWQVN